MNKEQFEAQAVFNQMQKRQALFAEFEAMRPNWKGSALRFVGSVVCMAFVVWMFPEITKEPVLILFLLLIFGLHADVYVESQRINKRIDTLYRLLKDDV
jgi:hypothetical protein